MGTLSILVMLERNHRQLADNPEYEAILESIEQANDDNRELRDNLEDVGMKINISQL